MTVKSVDLAEIRNRAGYASAGSRSVVVFTDLDGTLLDGHYSYHAADEALGVIRKENIPLVICSGKTRAEIEHYEEILSISGPFVSENGGAIFIPRGYFPPGTEEGPARCGEIAGNFRIIRLGARYRQVREVMKELRSRGFAVRGFGDMSVAEIADLTGLPIHEARLAARREFDEPFIFEGSAGDMEKIEEIVRAKGFRLARAAFFHISGQTDKGRAVSLLADMYRRERGRILTVALGDNPSDLTMLQTVDVPIIVQKPDGSYDPELEGHKFHKTGDIGPKGWNDAVLKVIGLAR